VVETSKAKDVIENLEEVMRWWSAIHIVERSKVTNISYKLVALHTIECSKVTQYKLHSNPIECSKVTQYKLHSNPIECPI
jgi:hypothetical protein